MPSIWDTIRNPSAALTGGGGAPVPEEAVGGDIDSIMAKAAQDLAGTGLAGGMEIDPMSAIEEALASAVAASSPSSGFIYGEDELPSWFPKALRPIVASNPGVLQQVYDPYLGERNGMGDERVFLGSKDFEVKSVGGSTGLGLTPSEARAAGKDHNEREGRGSMPVDGLTPSEARAAGIDHNDRSSTKRKRDKTTTLQGAVNMPYTWDESEVVDAMRRFRESGINVTSFDQLTTAWTALVERASLTYSLSAGRRKVTPWDVLELHKKEAESAGTLTDFENGTQTRTATSVTEISEGASWQVLQATLSQLLGRDPSDQEVRDYAYRMNSLASKNPSITETITRYKAGEAVSSESHTSGGFDSADMAKDAYDQAQDAPEYAKVQSGTTYYNAMLQALGAVGDV